MTEREAVINMLPNDGLHGRRKIYTDHKVVDATNIVKVIESAYPTHERNRNEIQYLLDYYKGKQDIREKKKIVRPEINNKVTVNRANEIVTFKTSYLLSGPVQYVSGGGKDGVSEDVAKLNQFMRAEDKDSKDKEVLDWMHIGGVGVRMTLPNESDDLEESPVCVYTLDPRESFVIYYSGVGERPVVGVLRQKDEKGNWKSCAYTKDTYYEVQDGKIIKKEGHLYGRIPIIEYLHNDARMGAFEVVISQLNAINTLESNRIDSIEDFVNAFDVFENCEISSDSYKQLTSGGQAIQIKSSQGLSAKVYRITSELNQSGTQTVVDDMYEAILTVCGMPNRNGGSSTSDTGAATIMRDGWQSAEARAKDTEKTFGRAEREFLRVVLNICKDTADLNLKMSDIKVEFTRKNLSNVQSKAQVLAEMLNNEKIHPKLAFQYSGMFSDSEDAYRISMDYYEENKKDEGDTKTQTETEDTKQVGSDETDISG